MKKTAKWLLLGLATGSLVCGLSACGGGVPEGYTGFVAGYDDEVVFGDTVNLDEYVDFVKYTGKKYVSGDAAASLNDYADYTLTLVKGEETIDLTDLPVFEVSSTMVTPGEWTIKYTVTQAECAYQGTYETKLTILAYPITAEISPTATNTIKYYKDSLVYSEYFDELRLLVNSYWEYTATMKDVTVDGAKQDLTGTDSYTFNNLGEHVFTMLITNEGGQTYESPVTLNVQFDPADTEGEGAVFIGDAASTKKFKIALDHEVTDVKINNKAIEATAVTGGIEIVESALYPYAGANTVTFKNGAGEIEGYNLTVMTQEAGVVRSIGEALTPVVTENIGQAGNKAVGVVLNEDRADKNVTYIEINGAYLKYVFETVGSDFFTFDMYLSAPYLRSVRESNGNNFYLTGYNNNSDPKDFMTGQKIGDYYRYSILYTKEAYDNVLKMKNVDSKLMLLWTMSAVTITPDSTDQKKGTFEPTYLPTDYVYLDNFKVGEYSAVVDFANGSAEGGVFLDGRTSHNSLGNAVVAFGSDYAYQVCVNNANGKVHGIRKEYLTWVFDVYGADKLTFKVYMPDDISDAGYESNMFRLVYNTKFDGNVIANLTHVYDATTHCFTVTMTKDQWQAYDPATQTGFLNIAYRMPGFSYGDFVYFDDFVAVKNA